MNTTVKIELLGKENYDTWKLQAQAILAKADLILSISPLELREIKDCETSNEIWLKLASIYESKESPDELPKPELLKIKLLEECKARKNREQKHNDAMFARGKCQLKNSQRVIEKSHRKDNEKSFKYKCHRCGKVGHMAKHCRSNPARQPQQRRINTQMTHQYCYLDKTSEISLCIGGRSNSKWCLDSGASSYMCSNKEMFLSMKNIKRTLSLANNKATEIMGTGTANLEIPGSDEMRSVKLHNTLYIPDLRSNLLSVAKITENPTFIAATAESKLPTLMEWHRRLGHLNERSLLELTRHEKVFGMKVGKEKLPNRNEVLDAFMDFKSHAENQTGNKIKTLRSENATEYCSEMFQKFLRVNGIRHETSVQYTPQQNGVAEKKNRTLLDMARCMLLESKSLNGEIPLTLWNGRKLTLNYFPTFGERAYVLDKSPGKGKFSTRSKECIFIGYSTESKAFRLWCPVERKLTAQNQEWPANDTREKEKETLELQLTPNESNETHQSGGTILQNEAEQVTETRKIKVLPGRERLVRSGRRGRPKKVYQKEDVQPVPCEDVASIVVMNDLKSVTKALSCHESKEWLEAMKREYEALVKNNTWEIVNRLQKQMMADVVTKGLFKSKHEKCISDLGLGNLCGESPKQFNNVGEVLGHITSQQLQTCLEVQKVRFYASTVQHRAKIMQNLSTNEIHENQQELEEIQYSRFVWNSYAANGLPAIHDAMGDSNKTLQIFVKQANAYRTISKGNTEYGILFND
ncbi:Retrovirus-related Pol polyprotein from transposon TNT 1-94 [Trichinella britovi]|uniref:Retrovirus-related Pol polyprotein from transposon TNT 1-94 n=1 Tax=Trichinella britovi TaxID=45882 RepID=A0A0V1CX06_TRIBR|nr:Retrovirus-related Pol polyprotein from transposon TNT 1-94 [Trichinella britovi]